MIKAIVYSEGIPKQGRQPASVENIAYYFNESLMLEKNGYLDEAFKMYREILSLPEANDSVKTAQEGLRLRIARLYGDEGLGGLLLEYFDIKQPGEGKFEITVK